MVADCLTGAAQCAVVCDVHKLHGGDLLVLCVLLVFLHIHCSTLLGELHGTPCLRCVLRVHRCGAEYVLHINVWS